MHKRFQQLSGFAIFLLLGACGGSNNSAPPAIGPVTTVFVNAQTSTVITGSSLQLTATASDANSNVVSGLTPTWTTSNSAVATVSTSGLVSGLANGAVTITATMSGIAGSKAFTVAPAGTAQTVQATDGLQFTPAQADIAVGGTVTWQFGAIQHTVTFLTTAAGTPSDIALTGSTSVSRTFTTAGTFNYHCTQHIGMNGTVVVH